MTKQVSIIGTAISQFGELWDKGLHDLLTESIDEVIKDAQINPSDIEAVFVANKAGGNFENQSHLNALASECFEHCPPAMRIEAACASGGAALLAAQQALLSGKYETVLVVGAEKMTDVSAEETTGILSSAADSVLQYGSTFPALYGLIADAYSREQSLPVDALAAIAVKNHKHALQNSKAQFRKALSIDQVLASPIVASPLHVFDCSPISDGAASIILTTRKHSAKAKIKGSGHGQDVMTLANRESLTTFQATIKAAQQAYTQAGLKPGDIQIAEVHDCFTIAEALAVSDLGFFTKEEAGIAALNNSSTYGGKITINPSGGLKACGHPVGATGVKQVAYLAEQLASSDTQFALAHNVGGAGATAVVHILEK
jgi:acetyl-CoA C-acetyltransferase